MTLILLLNLTPLTSYEKFINPDIFTIFKSYTEYICMIGDKMKQTLETLTESSKSEEKILSEPLTVLKGFCGLDEKLMPTGANINKIVYSVNISKGFITGLIDSDTNQPYNPNSIDAYDIGISITSTLPSSIAAINALETGDSFSKGFQKTAAVGVTGILSAGTAFMVNRLAYSAGYFSKPLYEIIESYLNK